MRKGKGKGKRGFV